MSQGAESLDQASEAMEQAEQELADENPDKAAEEEEKALARLREAERKLREEEDRLAALKQEQELRSVVMELIEVRRKQDGVNADARQFEAKRTRVSGNRGSHSRVSRKKLERLARTQGELAERVELLSTKLEEEVARVFAFILRDVGADMKQLQELLGEFDTGTLTDFLGRDVIAKIDRLLVSLKETMEREKEERKRQMQQQQQQQRRRRRLVTPIAELIMLKDMQVRVNRRTRNLENSRKAGAKGDIWERALSRLTQKQGDLTDMTIKIAEDFKNENEQRRREEQAEREGAESEDGEFDDEELSPEPEPESDESDL